MDTTPEVDDHQLVVTGIHARELLANPTFVAVVNDLEKQITTATFKTPIVDFNTRQNLYMLWKALENLVSILEASAQLVDTVEPEQSGIAPPDDPELTDLSGNLNY